MKQCRWEVTLHLLIVWLQICFLMNIVLQTYKEKFICKLFIGLYIIRVIIYVENGSQEAIILIFRLTGLKKFGKQ